jgi:hypothetical protein
MERQMLSRAQTNARGTDQPIALGTHHTLYYRCLATQEEHYSSVDEIVQWITTGPLLQRPTENPPRREQPIANLQPTRTAAIEPTTPVPATTPALSITSEPHHPDAESPHYPAPSTAIITMYSDDPARRISLPN